MSKNMIQQECDQWWFSHQRQICDAAVEVMDEHMQPLRAILNARFEAGARWAMQESAQMNPTVTRFLEMCMLLGFEGSQDAATVAEETRGGSGKGSGDDAQEYLPGLRNNVRVPASSSGNDADNMRSVQLEDNARREALEAINDFCVKQVAYWQGGLHGQSEQFTLGCCSAFVKVTEFITNLEREQV